MEAGAFGGDFLLGGGVLLLGFEFVDGFVGGAAVPEGAAGGGEGEEEGGEESEEEDGTGGTGGQVPEGWRWRTTS